MKKTTGSPLVLCILSAFIVCVHANQTAYGNSSRLQPGKSVVNNLILYSGSMAVVDNSPASGRQDIQAVADTPSAEQLGEMLLQVLQGSRHGQVAEVGRLLRLGANPEYKPHKKALSPLDFVVQNGMLTMAKVFRQSGVKFNKRGSRGITYLHQAAASGNLPMVEFLLSLGINPNTQTTKGWTPLHHAARFGHGRTVLFLIRAGSDSKLRNSDGFTPKELAINGRHYPVSKLFY